MYSSVVLSKKDFGLIHNAKCNINFIRERLEDTLHPSLLSDLKKICDDLNKGLKDAYKQEDVVFKQKSNMIAEFSKQHKLKSEWSIYSIESFDDVCGLSLDENDKPRKMHQLIYDSHWGENGDQKVLLPSEPFTWGQLWILADQLIRHSGDEHHVFIEDFTFVIEQEGISLRMSVGS